MAGFGQNIPPPRPPIIEPGGGYSPYGGNLGYGGGLGGFAGTISPLTGYPGFALDQKGLAQTYQQALAAAGSSRKSAGRQHQANLHSISSSAMDRGDYGGDVALQRGHEGDAYQAQLGDIARGVTAARQAQAMGLDKLALQNADFLFAHPTGPLAIQAAMLTPGAQQAGGNDPYYNPYLTRRPGMGAY